jgi:hypothetical protein
MEQGHGHGKRDPLRYERYTGRGLDWAKKPINKRKAKQVARYRAGLIIESVLNEGWNPDDLQRRYGDEGMELIKEHMSFLASWLTDTGQPS